MASLADKIPNQLSFAKGCHGSSSCKFAKGCHGSSSCKPGKYKKKVSASRCFPPQCGTNAEPIPPEALLDMIVSINDPDALRAHANSFQSRINILAWSCVLKKKSSQRKVPAMHKTDWRDKHTVVAKKSTGVLTSPIKKHTLFYSVATSRVLVARDGFTVNLSPCVGASSSHTNARVKIRDILRSFEAICKQLSELGKGKIKDGRIDLEAMKILKQEGLVVNREKYVGSVPGVEVGDGYLYRVELAIVGIHRPYRSGIDYTRRRLLKGTVDVIATSIVSSGYYDDGWNNTDVLIYTGQGGNIVGSKKEPEDQKMEKGNLALKNSVEEKNSVRVIRGSKMIIHSRHTTLVYDGLYIVEKCWKENGPHGKKVFKFELRRIPGQPQVVWKSRRVL